MKIHHKTADAVGVIFGVCFLVAATFAAQRRGWSFLLDQSDLWLVRYSLVIFFINAPLAFIVLGVMTWLGVLLPYNAPESTPASRAKGSAIGALITLPMWIAMSANERGCLYVI